MSNKVYDILKWLCLIAIPAVTVFLTTCLPVWGVADGTQTVIITTISAIGTLLGALIAVSTASYNRKSDSEESADE